MPVPFKVFHNPRCSKSRELVSLLVAKGVKFELVEYLKNPLSTAELNQIVEALDGDVSELIRTNEAAYKTLKVKPNSAKLIVQAIHTHPELMQRPIVLRGKRAVIARPANNVLELI